MTSSVMIPLNNISSKIEILYDDQNQPWFKRAHVGSYLEITHINTSVKNLDKSEMCTRDNFEPTSRSTAGWSGPKDQQNKTDIFLSVYGVMHVIVGSRKSKGKELKHHILTDVIPRGFNQIISEQQQRIEQKNSTIALLNDDLDESQREYAILDYKYEQLEYHAVPYLENPKKDNGMVVIQKNNGDEYPYLAICGQQGYVAQKIKNKLIDFPNGQIVVLAETGNSIVHYNYLRERGCIEVNPDRVRHFRLGRNLTHQDLLGIQEA